MGLKKEVRILMVGARVRSLSCNERAMRCCPRTVVPCCCKGCQTRHSLPVLGDMPLALLPDNACHVAQQAKLHWNASLTHMEEPPTLCFGVFAYGNCRLAWMLLARRLSCTSSSWGSWSPPSPPLVRHAQLVHAICIAVYLQLQSLSLYYPCICSPGRVQCRVRRVQECWLYSVGHRRPGQGARRCPNS